MGDKVLAQATNLRKAVTMQREFLPRLPQGTKFFHPLPRDARHPTLPFWLDGMQLNGWDQQSQNGYFTRIVLLGMVGGLLGSDFQGDDDRSRNQQSSPALMNWSPTMPKTPQASPGSSAIRDASDFIKEITVPADFLE